MRCWSAISLLIKLPRIKCRRLRFMNSTVWDFIGTLQCIEWFAGQNDLCNLVNKNKKPFCLLRNGLFNSLNRVNQNVNLIMKGLLAFKGSGFQRYWFWFSFGFGFCFLIGFVGLGWFRFFLGQDSGFFSRFQDFRNLVSQDSVFVFRTWTVSDFSGFGFRGLLN